MGDSYPELVGRLDQAVNASSIDEITRRVKGELEDLLTRGVLTLPEIYRQPLPDTYARRLLHRDPAGRYTAIIMTWGPGQGTAVHDHGGLWCVEGVVEGQIAVTQYDVTPDGGDRFIVAARDTMLAGVGTAGRLIPPTDFHVIANASASPSLTLHVYGGELCECRVFTPEGDGRRYASHLRTLSFH